MQSPTLDPVEIAQLHFLTRRQAEIYCVMDPATFRAFCLRRNVPFQCDKPDAPRAKRRFSRELLKKAMLDDMQSASPELGDRAAMRVQQIVGDNR